MKQLLIEDMCEIIPLHMSFGCISNLDHSAGRPFASYSVGGHEAESPDHKYQKFGRKFQLFIVCVQREPCTPLQASTKHNYICRANDSRMHRWSTARSPTAGLAAVGNVSVPWMQGIRAYGTAWPELDEIYRIY
jgi:hypothetical protein